MIRLIRRRLRSRTPVLAAFAPFAAVVMFLFATNTFMDAQTLTAGQEADAALGESALAISMFDLEIPAGSSLGDGLRTRFEDAKGQYTLAINAIEFPYFQSGLRGVFFTEKDWARSRPDKQFRLIDGRWPTKAREVALAGGRLSHVKLGDLVEPPGGGLPFTVVGVAEDRFNAFPSMLAAPGTWGSIAASEDDDSGLLTAFAAFESKRLDQAGLVERVASVVRSLPEAALEVDRQPDLSKRLQAGVRSRSQAAAEVARPWTTQSPLSLWVPGVIIVPMCLAIGYFVLLRTLARSGRRLVDQGVDVQRAALAVWLVPVPVIVGLATFAAVVGAIGGYELAQMGAGRWGYIVSNWRFPRASVVVCLGGMLVSLAAALLIVRGRVAPLRLLRVPTAIQRMAKPCRQIVAIGLGCFATWQFLTLNEPSDGMTLAGVGAFTLAFLSPELISVASRLMPQRTLAQRLVIRQVLANRSRMAAATGMYIVLIAVTVGVLTVLYSQIEMLRTQQPESVPPGHLLVDSNSTPFKSPPPGVIAALEGVPELRDQKPIQMYMIGERYVDPATGIEDARHTVGTQDLPGLSFAFDSVNEVEAAYGRPLTARERSVLAGGGALVVNPERVRISAGHIALVDNTTGQAVGRLQAVAARPSSTRWTDAVPFVILRTTADRLGLKSASAARLYVHVGSDTPTRARDALIRAGFNPRLIGTHEVPPPVVPPAALVGSAVGLMLLVAVVSLLATRTQVRSMRRWAGRLTHLGVRSSWARRVVGMQFVWILAVATPGGLFVGLGALQATHARLPTLDFVFPWAQILLAVVVVLAATLFGAGLAARNLGQEEVGLE